MLLKFLLFSLLINSTFGSEEENNLRNYLFGNNKYNKNIRPVKNYSNPIEIQQGIAVQTLESFNQIDESLSLNLWIRSNWKDEYLRWDNSNNSDFTQLDFLSVTADDIWIPDSELLNAATKPEIYLLQGGISVYPDGSIFYSKPGIYKSSCSLDLRNFPFDKQNCTLLIGSWVYNDHKLQLIPNKDIEKQVDVLSSFSHSEWRVNSVKVRHLKEERDCCPDQEFDLISYSFILGRYTHYYRISMGMTITLVVVSFVITLMSPSNVSRTSTAVFIPLTILALQLTIANKIPVVGYYTLMDKFFLCCFITSMICSIESGLVYAVITAKSPRFYDLLDSFFKFKFPEIQNDNDNENTNSEDKETVSLKEFRLMEESLEKVAHEDNLRMRINMPIKENNSVNNENENDNDVKMNTNYLLTHNIQKTIPYDDKRLYLTPRQEKIDALVNRYLNRLDTIIRIILPVVFFSYITYIFSKG